jgi:hypothetical protein
VAVAVAAADGQLVVRDAGTGRLAGRPVVRGDVLRKVRIDPSVRVVVGVGLGLVVVVVASGMATGGRAARRLGPAPAGLSAVAALGVVARWTCCTPPVPQARTAAIRRRWTDRTNMRAYAIFAANRQ